MSPVSCQHCSSPTDCCGISTREVWNAERRIQGQLLGRKDRNLRSLSDTGCQLQDFADSSTSQKLNSARLPDSAPALRAQRSPSTTHGSKLCSPCRTTVVLSLTYLLCKHLGLNYVRLLLPLNTDATKHQQEEEECKWRQC